MKTSCIAPIALAAFLAVPAALPAQDSTSGKIGDVQHSADASKHKGGGSGGEDEGGGGWFFGGWHTFTQMFFGVYPSDTGQGYQSFPYAERGAFVRERVTEGRTFGSVSASYFADDQSTLRADHFVVEWAGGFIRREIEFSSYWEPLATKTDHLQMFRMSFTAVPPLGDVGYLKVGAGVQVVTVGADAATGPEVEAGVQLFPRPPFGLGATARVAPLTWAGGPEWGVGFVDISANGSVFLGRFELQAGYRWTRIGTGAPFRGPTLGMRVWF
jgi:hypothetical protein